ncbi:hypothetical protein L1887_60036 [Cichorium endivia]|nr:hypothetical protein L1887_60036 [Cichorium endivia]
MQRCINWRSVLRRVHWQIGCALANPEPCIWPAVNGRPVSDTLICNAQRGPECTWRRGGWKLTHRHCAYTSSVYRIPSEERRSFDGSTPGIFHPIASISTRKKQGGNGPLCLGNRCAKLDSHLWDPAHLWLDKIPRRMAGLEACEHSAGAVDACCGIATSAWSSRVGRANGKCLVRKIARNFGQMHSTVQPVPCEFSTKDLCKRKNPTRLCNREVSAARRRNNNLLEIMVPRAFSIPI